MAEYKVPATMPTTRFGLTGIESIKQNVMIIASTYQGTAPLDRSLGIDSSIFDQPENSARLLLRGRIIEAVEAGEPRAEVISVDYIEQEGSNESGRAIPYVRFRERGVE
ncbi:GPW/gp25 family protein [Paenibacillus pabuli]|uniref:GPW/gp25 family protein n=1 Tax=Paenibacillus pabuli TaxID=1472 RepID=UPI001FFEC1FF|nr:GPW/gp25 family protein [Paenibacillus pabuli]UPK45901.1 lysozyme [Paenibacillus pabuli]